MCIMKTVSNLRKSTGLAQKILERYLIFGRSHASPVLEPPS